MEKSTIKHTPKVIRKFIGQQMASFISSKGFKKRVTDFLFDAVDDVVNVVLDNKKTSK